MRINNLSKIIGITAITSASIGCTRKPLSSMPEELISKEITQKMDSLSKETQKTLEDTTYKFYGYDTLKINKNFSEKPEDFQDKINSKAKSADKTVVTGQYTKLEPIFFNNKMHLYPKTHFIEEKAHLNHRAVIKNPQIYTTDSTDMYVPVEYYGKINPKAIEESRKK